MSCNFSNVKKRSLIHNERLPAFVSIFDMLQIMYRNAKIIYQEFIFFCFKKVTSRKWRCTWLNKSQTWIESLWPTVEWPTECSEMALVATKLIFLFTLTNYFWFKSLFLWRNSQYYLVNFLIFKVLMIKAFHTKQAIGFCTAD